MFLIYSLQNLTDCDKIRYIMSWVEFIVQKCKPFYLTWIVSLPYLVKLSIHVSKCLLMTVICDNANRLLSRRPIIHHITSYLYVLSLIMIMPHPNPTFQLGNVVTLFTLAGKRLNYCIPNLFRTMCTKFYLNQLGFVEDMMRHFGVYFFGSQCSSLLFAPSYRWVWFTLFVVVSFCSFVFTV